MGTIQNERSKFLQVISRNEAKRFLKEWANLREDQVDVASFEAGRCSQSTDDALNRIFRHSAAILHPLTWDKSSSKLQPPPSLPWPPNYRRELAYKFQFARDTLWFLSYGRALLRKAWDAPDDRTREWYAFSVRRYFASKAGILTVAAAEEIGQKIPIPEPTWLDECPPITPFEAALLYLQTKIGDLARHCKGPECPAPYFIAEKRWQKYCSPECAGPATRESKREWARRNRKEGKL